MLAWKHYTGRHAGRQAEGLAANSASHGRSVSWLVGQSVSQSEDFQILKFSILKEILGFNTVKYHSS